MKLKNNILLLAVCISILFSGCTNKKFTSTQVMQEISALGACTDDCRATLNRDYYQVAIRHCRETRDRELLLCDSLTVPDHHSPEAARAACRVNVNRAYDQCLDAALDSLEAKSARCKAQCRKELDQKLGQ